MFATSGSLYAPYLGDAVLVEVPPSAVLVFPDGGLHLFLHGLILGVIRKQVYQHRSLTGLE
ncbi:hypothetical protein DPMN_167417 [Dreissena polymorpha]|uniref:Uncharacterized protein n=1 Tax=Dreissena polymorpha TaxID=45954 RepID=A0A9D4F4H6_DREPO|nr:hypothetical protein DPMN_167417 [Dreissena polymorpha]